MSYNENISYAENLNISVTDYESVAFDNQDFSVRLYNALSRANINTIGKILEKTPSEILAVRNLGRTSIIELERFLESLPKSFRASSPKILPTKSSRSNAVVKPSELDIIKDNILEIAAGDFNFLKEKELDECEINAIDIYKKAVNILGDDLAFNCLAEPDYVLTLHNSLLDFYMNAKRYNEIKEILDLLPEGRSQMKAEGFIRAFKSDASTRAQLRTFYHSDDSPLSDFSEELIFESNQNYKLFSDFLKWCCFDIVQDIRELLSKVYYNDRARFVIYSRSHNKTLEETGQSFNVTRERVRQIEAKVFKFFRKFNSRYKIMMKISAIRDGDSAITYDDLELYAGGSTPELFYMFSKNSSANYTFDKSLEVFILGDDSLPERTQNYLDTLPDMIHLNKIDDVIHDGCDEEDIPFDILKKAFHDTYKLTGDVFHRSRLTMSNVYSTVLSKYYPDGCHIYDSVILQDFRQHIREDFGDISFHATDRAMSARIADIGILCGKGIYRPKKKQYISKNLERRIYDYITLSSNEIFLMNQIFDFFEDDLIDQGIDNKYYLQGVLHEIFPDKFYFTRDYLSKNPNITSLYKPIAQYVQRSKYPVSKQELSDAFPGIPESIIFFAVDTPDILCLFGQYIYAGNLILDSSETAYIKLILDNVLRDGCTHNCHEIFDIINSDRPEILSRNYIVFPFAMYSLLKYLFPDDYQFSRPFVSVKGVDMESPYNHIKIMPYGHETYPISKLKKYLNDNKLHIRSLIELLNSYNDEFFIKDKHTLVSFESIGITENTCRAIENLIFKELDSTVPIYTLKCWSKFPQISVPWSDWLVYSCINKWGKLMDVSTSSNHFYNSVPIIAPATELDRKALSNTGSYQNKGFEIDDLDNIDDILEGMIDDSDFWEDDL